MSKDLYRVGVRALPAGEPNMIGVLGLPLPQEEAEAKLAELSEEYPGLTFVLVPTDEVG